MQAEKPEALWYHRVMTEPQKPKSMVPAVLGMAAVVAVFAVAITTVGKPSRATSSSQKWSPDEVFKVLDVQKNNSGKCSLFEEDEQAKLLSVLQTNGKDHVRKSFLLTAPANLKTLTKTLQNQNFRPLEAAFRNSVSSSQFLVSQGASKRIVFVQTHENCLTLATLEAGTVVADVVAAQVKPNDMEITTAPTPSVEPEMNPSAGETMENQDIPSDEGGPFNETSESGSNDAAEPEMEAPTEDNP